MEFKPGTSSVWEGEWGHFSENAATLPIFQTATYSYDDIEQWEKIALGEKPGHIYSRNTNPTLVPLEKKIAALEGAEAATSFASGMAAISNTLFALLKPGSRVVSIKDTYGGTNRLFTEFLPKWGVSVQLCETHDENEIIKAVEHGCNLLYLETPTNPTLKVLNIRKLAQVAHRSSALVVVDNTFSTPLNQQPLALGADIVLHSATKFLGGHSDALGGLICGRKDLVKKVFEYREITGATLSPMAAYLILRGMKTLELRIQRQNDNAQKVSEFLNTHPKIVRVFYPGLPTHPNHSVAKEQMSGFGGVLSFEIRGDETAMGSFLKRLKFAHRAASLGAVGTLVGPPKTTSHVELTKEQRVRAGIPENLVRYSAGIENVEDLIQDLTQALG